MIGPSKYDSIRAPGVYRVREIDEGFAVYDSRTGEPLRIHTQRNNAQRAAQWRNQQVSA